MMKKIKCKKPIPVDFANVGICSIFSILYTFHLKYLHDWGKWNNEPNIFIFIWYATEPENNIYASA